MTGWLGGWGVGGAMSLTNTLVCRNALSSFDCSHKRQNQNKLKKNSARRGPHRKQKKRQRVNKRCGEHTYPKCTSCQDFCTAENRSSKSFIDWDSVFGFFSVHHPHVLLPPYERHFKLVELVAFAGLCLFACLPCVFILFFAFTLYVYTYICIAMSIYLYLHLNLPPCSCLLPCVQFHFIIV